MKFIFFNDFTEKRPHMKNKLLEFIKAVTHRLGAVIKSLKQFFARKPARTPEGRFQVQWADILQANAGLYNGLYAGLERVRDKTAKKPEKIMKEWHARTVYKWEESPIAALCGETLTSAVESADPDACAKWAELLLNAAQSAGITKETAEELELDETTIRAYVEWDGNDLYVGDRVKVLHPAWYQNGQVIEQGHCTLFSEGDAE